MTDIAAGDRDDIDWSLTTFDGARREAMRRWASLPLDRVISALEEMESLAKSLATPDARGAPSEPDAAPGRAEPPA